MLERAVPTIAAAGDSGDLASLWIHGTGDQLVRYGITKAVIDVIGGNHLEHFADEVATHTEFNETIATG